MHFESLKFVQNDSYFQSWKTSSAYVSIFNRLKHSNSSIVHPVRCTFLISKYWNALRPKWIQSFRIAIQLIEHAINPWYVGLICPQFIFFLKRNLVYFWRLVFRKFNPEILALKTTTFYVLFLSYFQISGFVPSALRASVTLL